MTEFWTRHADLVARGLEAASARHYWSAFPETPSGKIYGESAKDDGEAAFKALIGKAYSLPDHPGGSAVGAEHSPYGLDLSISYPQAPVDALIIASKVAGQLWGAASPDTRVGVAVEIITRLNKASFLLANAVMHTTGQAFPMAFQAGGPHAQDRALEAVVYAHAEMSRVPGHATWEKPQGRGEPLKLDKRFRIVPRGVSLVIGCATFPTWNSYPALFASLATGNTVIVKPHPKAILPLAITVKIAREVLAEAGFDPNVVLLAPDTVEAPRTKELAAHPDVDIVDFTGSSQFGGWLRANLAGKQVFTEEAGLNSIVIDGTSSFKGMCDNIAFSLSLYTGQMCTAPQNIFVPAAGIETDEGHKSYDDVAKGIADAVDRLLADPARASAVLGAVQNPETIERVAFARGLGRVVRDSAPVPGAAGRTATPLILAVDASATDAYEAERFGPIAFVIRTETTADSIARAASGAKAHGAITAALYSTDEAVIEAAEKAFAHATVALSVNLIGGIFVNQSAAFSDFHVSGGNPAGNACLTDTAFVANRFRVAAVRRLAA